MPCGIMTPVAQLGKSWSNARKACWVHTRPSRKSCPRCSFALVSRENTGSPAAKYLAFSSAMRRNWASRSGLCPPAKTLAILCRPNFCSFIQSRTTGGLTGVPMSVTVSASCRDERSVHSTPASSGLPAVRTSSTDFKFSTSSGWVSTIFFSPAANSSHSSRCRIVWQPVQLGQSAFNGSLRASEHLGHILDPAMPQPPSLDGSIPSSIFLGQRLIKGPNLFHHFRIVLQLKYEGHPWLHSKGP